MLTPHDLSTLSRLLDQALALPVGEREAWLLALPADTAPLQDALREMLEREAGLTADPQLRTLPRLGAWAGDDPSSVHAGDRIGPYRLIEEIGRGGMGSVWRAERADGSFQREVALKLPRLTWGEGLARLMAQERDIAAMLEHPNIARLYDAGLDGRGWPYLALELVKGSPIDRWCKEQGLSLSDKLALLLQLMKALSHAHARLIVHRDLKPSNVLVTPDGQAHLLDFGIAKLLGDAGAGQTEDGARRLTPHYAAPEQLRGEAVTVATDVYSLGVLAYELLSGQLPYHVTRNSRAAWEEAVLAGEPELASRRCADRATARALRGDLDAILAKALQREPAQRYGSVDAMAEDLQRHLRGEAVLAQPESFWQRTGRRLRRHRVAVTSSTAVLAALAVGGGVALRSQLQAEAALERQRLLTRFASAVLSDGQARLLARSNDVRPPYRPAPDDTAERIKQLFPDDLGLQAELMQITAQAQIDVGLPDEAGLLAGQQLAVLQRARAPAAAQAGAQLLAAEAWLIANRLKEAEAAARAALKLAGDERRPRAEAVALQAWIAWHGRDGALAQTLLRELDALRPGLTKESTAPARGLALRAEIDARHGLSAQAAAGLQQAIELALRAQGENGALVLGLRQLAAARLVDQGQLDAAAPLLRAATRTLDARGGPAAIEARILDAEFAVASYRRGALDYTAAAQAMAKAEGLIDAGGLRPVELRRRLTFAQAELALVHGAIPAAWQLMSSNGWPKGAGWPRSGWITVDELQFRRALAWNELELLSGKRFAAPVGPWLLELRGRMGPKEATVRAVDQARVALTAAWAGDTAGGLALLEQLDQADSGGLLAWVRAQLLLDLGQADAAAEAIRGLDLPSALPMHAELLSAEAVAAQLDCAQGRVTKGRDRLLAEANVLLKDRSPSAPRPAWLRAQAGLCALADQDLGRARELAAQARQAFSAQPEVADYFKRPLLKLEAALRAR